MLEGEEGVIYSFCAPTDVDFFCHMNNARYFREMDFGRFDFYFRSRLGNYFVGNYNEPIVGHSGLIRYRRPLDFLMPFRLHTKLVYFDERSFYFEQRFVSIHDDFVRAVAVHQNTAKNTDVLALMRDFVGMEQPKEIPEVVSKFLEINEISSQQLRREAGLGPKKEGKEENDVEAADEENK